MHTNHNYMYLVNTSLGRASKNGHFDVARVLLENGAMVDAIDEYGKLIHVPFLSKCW